MRIIIFLIASMVAFSSYATCEASYKTGKHSAVSESEAKSGALEDAKDRCYPGDAEPTNLNCGVNDDGIIVCEQTVVCTLCGDDLVRKYEALD